MNYFTKQELKCPHCDKFEIDDIFLKRANQARHYADVPFIVNSAYRCEERNKWVGGSPNSSHLKGMAMDVKVKNSWFAERILWGLKEAGISRIFVYVNPKEEKDHSLPIHHIHFDTDGDKPQDIFGVRTY